MPPVKLVVIGLGEVARHRHIPAMMRNPDIKLIGVIDRRQGRAEKTARKHGVLCAQTDTLDQVPWLNEIDGILVATPPMTHEAIAVAAIEKGKHVLVEKPFAMNVAEGENIVAAARKNGRIAAVVHNFQYGRSIQKMLKDIAKGRLGRLKRVSIVQLGNPQRAFPKWIDQLPAGQFYDESPHLFYIARLLAGKNLKLLQAHSCGDGKKLPPRLVALVYENEARIPVTISCDNESALSEWHVIVTGEKAMGIADLYRDFYMRLPNDGAHKAGKIVRTSLYAIAQHAWQYVPNGLAQLRGRLDFGSEEVVARFARAIRGERETLAGMAPEDALDVLKLQHEALKALGYWQ